jgi:hypothetical protein
MKSVTRLSYAVCLCLVMGALILAMYQTNALTLGMALFAVFVATVHGWHKAIDRTGWSTNSTGPPPDPKALEFSGSHSDVQRGRARVPALS